MSIEDRWDTTFIAAMALKEKQIQQSYRPIIAVHKWFARRPGTLFRGLILSEFSNRPLKEAFFSSNDFTGRRIADPFMGGGTPLLEANRVGCDVQGFDINPMAAWIVREEIEHLDIAAYREEVARIATALETDIGAGYRTDCSIYGDPDVPVKYFLWVKVLDCQKCGFEVDLFPSYLIADDTRHPKNVVVCAQCGELNEVEKLEHLGKCRNCREALIEVGPAKKSRCACSHCGHINKYPRPALGAPKHRLFAIEYFNPLRKSAHLGRFFKKPDDKDLERVKVATARWKDLPPIFVPQEEILPGDETDRLHKWGYRRYRDLFNERQLLGLETICRLILSVPIERVRHALATNLSDLLRYQNMLCRYDTMALKSLDIFSVHGFPVGLIQCESNLLGIANLTGASVGSGGWRNITEKYAKAKHYCNNIFEVNHKNGRKTTIPIEDEWIGENRPGRKSRNVSIRCISSTQIKLEPGSLDGAFTDPPYFGNVQYGELMDFCYVWLRQLVSSEAEGFDRLSTRSTNELTGNQTESRGLVQFAEGLSAVYQAMAHALKPEAPLTFTFHHNKLEAYETVGVAILDSGLTCSASLACPAEMSGSIHIHGTGSSIVDTIFVCRLHGQTRLGQMFEGDAELVDLIQRELGDLRAAGMRPTSGDIRCIAYGHLTRMAVWKLRDRWDPTLATAERLAIFHSTLAELPDPKIIIELCKQSLDPIAASVPKQMNFFQGVPDAVSF